MIDRLKYTAPIACSLNITGRCNLKCRHCSAKSESKYSKDMTTGQLRKVIDALVNRAHVFKVHVSGGEPLIREDFFEIMSIFKDNHMPTSLFTNATLISNEIAQKLASETNVLSINTSLDGSKPSTHDALRGSGAFKRAVRGIRLLKKAGFKVHVNCIVSKLNAKELPRIAQTAQELGASIAFNPATLVGRARENASLFTFTKKEMDSICDIVNSLTNKFECVTGGVVLEWPKQCVGKLRRIKFQTKPGDNLAYCDICKEAISIRPDGWVVPCNNFWNYKIGNILEQDILEIYHSEKAQRIRNLMTLTSDKLDGCNNCIYTGVCSGGCRAAAYASSDSLTGIDPFRCFKQYMQDEMHTMSLG